MNPKNPQNQTFTPPSPLQPTPPQPAPFQPQTQPFQPPATPQTGSLQSPFPGQLQTANLAQQMAQLNQQPTAAQFASQPPITNQSNAFSQPQIQAAFTQNPAVQNLQPQPNLTPAQNPTIATTTNAPAPDLPNPNSNHPLATQSTLLISELRDSMVIMKDGSFRAVIACQSINFDLMSEAEREGVEYSFQDFLNSLTFTTQILVRSQRIDIKPYIDTLVNIRRQNDNMLLGVLMDDYINFIYALSQEANIMDKSFFIVVPYYSSADAEKMVEQTKNFFKSFSNKKAPEITKIDRQTYDTAVSEILKRTDAIISGLFRIGIQSIRLNTKELAQLYYNFNNPDTAVRQPLVDFTKVAGLYVKKENI